MLIKSRMFKHNVVWNLKQMFDLPNCTYALQTSPTSKWWGMLVCVRTSLWTRRQCRWVSCTESSIWAPTNGLTVLCHASWGKRVLVSKHCHCNDIEWGYLQNVSEKGVPFTLANIESISSNYMNHNVTCQLISLLSCLSNLRHDPRDWSMFDHRMPECNLISMIPATGVKIL